MNRYFLQVYGCQMNACEAGVVRAVLEQAGYVETADEADADVLLMLTCAVRSHAEQRALGRLGTFRALRRSRARIVGVLGCMSRNLKEVLASEHAADLVVGPDGYRRLPELIGRARAEARPQLALEETGECYEGIRPAVRNPVCGSVTVMRGCNNYCTYCVVPYARGRERSRTADQVIGEVEHLASEGGRDLTLLGQNVLAYRDGDTRFPALLRRAAAVEGIERVRFLTSHPRDLDRELLETVAGTPEACPALHLPVQSGSDRILRAMNRGYTRAGYLERIALARAIVPGLVLTTDILVGFPSETEADFLATLDLVRAVRFDFAYMFRFSARPGTGAERLEPKVSEAEAGRRLTHLIEVQNRITRERSEEMVGHDFELLVEGPGPHGHGMLGRTRGNKVVIVRGPARIGETVTAAVTGIRGWTPLADTVAAAAVT